jgi:hypothetical protein
LGRFSNNLFTILFYYSVILLDLGFSIWAKFYFFIFLATWAYALWWAGIFLIIIVLFETVGSTLRLALKRWKAQMHFLFSIKLQFIIVVRSLLRFVLMRQDSCCASRVMRLSFSDSFIDCSAKIRGRECFWRSGSWFFDRPRSVASSCYKGLFCGGRSEIHAVVHRTH